MNPFFKNINISDFFRKIKLKFSIYMIQINPEKFPVDSIIKLRKPFLKKLQFSRKNFRLFGNFQWKICCFFENIKVFTRIFEISFRSIYNSSGKNSGILLEAEASPIFPGGWGTPHPLKGDHAPPQWSGGEGSPDAWEVSFLKRFSKS